MADEVRNGETMQGNNARSASLLIERERDLLKIREDVARGVDVHASAITAATLALVAVAASSDAFGQGTDGWLIAAGILLFLSALAGGIARLPAPPPLKALVMPRERERLFGLYAAKPGAKLRRIGRDFGAEIRRSEQRLRAMTLATPPVTLANELPAHWRARNNLARYRMHSKSAWFTLRRLSEIS